VPTKEDFGITESEIIASSFENAES